MSKKLYLVIGSEDGPIGIFSSHSKALVAAIKYANPFNELDGQELAPTVTKTKYVTTVSGRNFVEIRNDLDLNVDYF
tara:strand:- start:12375 stop:12605 length:231 start_codon:yes stop_codon:yes gene_type:complete